MRSSTLIMGMVAALALAGCKRENGDTVTNEVPAAIEANGVAPEAKRPDASTSPAAAADVVRAYAALTAQREFTKAADYWTDPAAAAQFAADLDDYPKVAMTVGTPTDEEGAAGSIFISVPVDVGLTLRSGSPYPMTCKATLRRVNDVPGATAKQLRWNIQSIDC
ncbi:MAG: hypothetical protein ABIO29_04080 [Sphingomicrobium sp.]